jgi:hypothetical protein
MMSVEEWLSFARNVRHARSHPCVCTYVLSDHRYPHSVLLAASMGGDYEAREELLRRHIMVVDQCSWDTADAKLEEIKAFNRKNMASPIHPSHSLHPRFGHVWAGTHREMGILMCARRTFIHITVNCTPLLHTLQTSYSSFSLHFTFPYCPLSHSLLLSIFLFFLGCVVLLQLFYMMPYKLGIYTALFCGFVSIPLIFHLDSVLWFNDMFVTFEPAGE